MDALGRVHRRRKRADMVGHRADTGEIFVVTVQIATACGKQVLGEQRVGGFVCFNDKIRTIVAF